MFKVINVKIHYPDGTEIYIGMLDDSYLLSIGAIWIAGYCNYSKVQTVEVAEDKTEIWTEYSL